ncbi:MAG: NAD-binding protein, partial [Pseudomonadota bacterium]
LGKLLGLASKSDPGVLIVGASPWSIQLAKRLKEMKIPVLVTDQDYRRLREARQGGIDTYYGEILSEITEHHVELVRYGYLLAVSGNEAYNALVCTDLAPEMNRAQTYQLSSGTIHETRTSVSVNLQGRRFLSGQTSLEDLLRRHWAGWTFQTTKLSETYTPEAYLETFPEKGMLVMVERKGALIFENNEQPIKLQIGDRVLSYLLPQDEKKQKTLKNEEGSASPDVEAITAKKKEAIQKVSLP